MSSSVKPIIAEKTVHLSMEPTIFELDLRALVRLLGEAAALPDPWEAKRDHLLERLCDLIGACQWRWTLFDLPPDRPEAIALHSCQHVVSTTPLCALPPDTHWETPHVVVASQKVAHQGFSVIALVRSLDDRPYTSRETTLARLVLEQIPWLHQKELPPTQERRLFPRLALMEALLLEGLSRKEIASRTGLSLGTVNGYIRDLYGFYAVNSHAELIRLRSCHPSTSSTPLPWIAR